MVQRGYLGIHAEVPTAQYLRSAIVVNGASRSRSRSKVKQSGGMSSIYVAEPPLSRASSLPHGVAGVHSICTQHKNLWERACSRWRQHSQHHHKLTLRYREQVRSHRRNAFTLSQVGYKAASPGF
ncbi:nucleoid-structuring protein H-NS [Pseudomonas brassicacearum]|nr:nucleoid-structuring protein H-NS [Pseudomonas brassicacearum]